MILGERVCMRNREHFRDFVISWPDEGDAEDGNPKVIPG
jgi:hypothetical protein